MKPSGRSRTEWRRGGRSPEVKKQSSCSPLRKRRRSPSPGGGVKEPNAHEVLKGILKSGFTKEDHSSRSRNKIPQEVKISRKSETVSKGRKPSSRRSPSPGGRWGQERMKQSPASRNLGGSPRRRRQSPSPYAGSRKGRSEKRSPDRRPRDMRVTESSHHSQHMGEMEVRKGGGRGQEERRWSTSKEQRVEDKRKRSPSREDLVSSTRSDMLEADTGYRKVYISWDRFVPKSFLRVHFSRFGEVEYIWMADRGAFFGFVNFVREEVGRSLVGACHYVEGVQILIKKAKPDWKMREERRIKTCAFFKEGRCLRHGHCRFLHSVEPRTCGGRSRSRSRERARRRERVSIDQGDKELKSRRDRHESCGLSEQKNELKTALPDEGSSERDGRLRPPPSVQEKVKVQEMLPLPVSARSAEERKRDVLKEEKTKKMGNAEDRSSKGEKKECRGKDRQIMSSGDNMDQEAMRARIKQLEQALKEKEEADARKKQFLKTGKPNKCSGMEKDNKLKEEKSSGEKFRGSKKNCHLVKSLAKRFKAAEKVSTSSSREDTDGYDSTSDSNTPSPSPSPPARQPLAKMTRPGGSESLGNHDPVDCKDEAPEPQKTEIKDGDSSFSQTIAGGAVAGGGDFLSKEVDKGEKSSKSVQEVDVEDSDWGKENVEEQQDEDEDQEEQLNQEFEDQKKSEGSEEDGFDVNENMLGSEKQAECGEDLASVDICKVRVESSCLISRLGKLESEFDALQEKEENPHEDGGRGESEGQTPRLEEEEGKTEESESRN